MLEEKRVPLLTLGDRGKVKIFDGPTIRLNIKLDLPDESNSSEFSYVYLIEGKNDEAQVNEDPFAKEEREDMEKLQKIADSFNSKYGGSSKKSKKRKRNIGDLIDRGEGYCEDSFVDNSEAYDEVVPWCLDTKHGGFYINEGVLDFVKNEDSDLDDGQPNMKKGKMDDNSDALKKKSKLGDQKKQKLKKKLKHNMEISYKLSEDVRPTQVPVINNNAPIHKVDKLMPTMVEKAEITLAEEEASELEESFNNNNNINTSNEEQNEDPTVGQLITELTCEIIQKVALARASQPPAAAGENQIPQLFGSGLMECLTRLYSLCQTRKNEEKHSVFERIASACNCQKEQLYKKIKRYRMNLLLDELSKRKAELNEAISRVMPGLVEKYKHDLEESNKLKMMTKEAHGSGDSDAEDNEGKTDLEKVEKAKRIMAPRRKFMWSMEIRNLLCEVVSLKMRHFDMAKIKSQSAEEHLKSFLESEIKPLWPTGWILTRALYKESKPAHTNWTGDQIKIKKGASTTVIHSATLLKTSVVQQQQTQQAQPLQLPQNTNQQPQVASAIKPLNAVHASSLHSMISNVVDEPIVINLDESDNESKAPSVPVGKHANKNVFTQLKEKPNQDTNKSESRPHIPNVLVENENPVLHSTTSQARNEIPYGGNVTHSTAMTLASTAYLVQAKDLQTCHKNTLDSPSKYVCSVPIQAPENKDQIKQDVYPGKFISNTTKSFPSNPVAQTNAIKQKIANITNSEDGANIFKGFQASGSQIDLPGDSSQVPRKRTSSQTNSGQYSEATHQNSPALQVAKVQPETSPIKQVTLRTTFDTSNQNHANKNVPSNWDGVAYHQHIPQTPSSHIFQHQILQQQYQQFQQHKQVMKKSPKQEKMLPNQSTNASFTTVQSQPSSLVMGNIKSIQHQNSIAKPDGTSEVFTKDHHQDLSRGRQNESSNLQRGFPAGTSFIQNSNEPKISSFQKSPIKKDVTTIQSHAAFQNLSQQNKQQLQQILLKSQHSQNNQHVLKSQQPLDSNISHLRHPSPQTLSGQQLRNTPQHYAQSFFRAQNFPQDGSAQQKN